jgi:hypothetical protein
LVLDGRLQLGYVVLVAGVCATIAFALGLLIHQQATFASAQILAALERPGMEWVEPATRNAVRSQLNQTDSGFLLSMLAVGFGLILVVVISLIVMTHQSAGPIHRMTRTFEAWHQGRMVAPGQLRRRDQFQGAFASLREAHAVLKERSQVDGDAMAAFLTTAAQDLDGVEELRALVDAKRSRFDH